MIDFRYHLVTLIAIFLSLAVGIVVGTTALNGPVVDGLRDRNAGLISEKRALQSDMRDLQAEVDAGDAFAQALAPDLVAGELAGQDVVLVVEPGAERGLADELAEAVQQAGANVTGRLALQQALLDPTSGQLVEDLVAQVVPAGLDLPDGSAAARAGAELAAALLRNGADEVSADEAQQVLSGFDEAGLIEFSSNSEELGRASLAVVVAAPTADEAEGENRDAALAALIDLIEQFDERSEGVVVAGPPEARVDNGLIRAVRANGDLADAVSTVDNADRELGQVAVALALAEQLAGRAGRYGSGAGVQGTVPERPAAE